MTVLYNKSRKSKIINQSRESKRKGKGLLGLQIEMVSLESVCTENSGTRIEGLVTKRSLHCKPKY